MSGHEHPTLGELVVALAVITFAVWNAIGCPEASAFAFLYRLPPWACVAVVP